MSSPKLNSFAKYVKKHFHSIKEAGEEMGQKMSAPEVIQILADNWRKDRNLPSIGPSAKRLHRVNKPKIEALPCTAEFKQMCREKKPPAGYCHRNATRRSCRKSRSRAASPSKSRSRSRSARKSRSRARSARK